MALGHEAALPARDSNLIDLTSVLRKSGIAFWLQGRTLLGIVENSALLEDHDDDIGVWENDWTCIGDSIATELRQIGFECIRDSRNIVSFLRDNRYIDVCKFRRKVGSVGYADKRFPAKHFYSAESRSYLGTHFPVPLEPQKLLNAMYRPGVAQRVWYHSSRIVSKLTSLEKYRDGVVQTLVWLPHSLRLLAAIPSRLLGIRYVQLSEDAFKAAQIEPKDSFNWRWRKPHLDLVTDGGRLTFISDIIEHFREGETLDRKREMVIETDTSKPFWEPANFDPRFWQSGNNYFLYCIIYQYRHGVLAYTDANTYIVAGGLEDLYTARYYENLPKMNINEIIELQRAKPLEMKLGAIVGGKHRSFAMIGRLVAGEEYLPFWTITRNC